MIKNRGKTFKILIYIILIFPLVAFSQDEATSVSPVRAAIDEARKLADDGDAAGAVAVLQGLADTGFTAVGVIQNDEVLGQLEGNEDYEALIAEMNVSAYPCEHDEKFREFDFWVGQWDVHVANGTFAGHNEIERAHRGCVLIENWSSASGGGGMSINYLDEASGEWVQVWNDASGSQIHIRGGLTEDGMLLTGKIHYVASDTTADFRGLWTPLDDGRVRQFFEQSSDGGQTWAPWFEGFYTRTTASD